MKKILALCLAVILCLGLVGCMNKDKENDSQPPVVTPDINQNEELPNEEIPNEDENEMPEVDPNSAAGMMLD